MDGCHPFSAQIEQVVVPSKTPDIPPGCQGAESCVYSVSQSLRTGTANIALPKLIVALPS